ncbi:MAG: NAD-dependent epimerase/dehydratase family protein [Caulobacteraceae bacterium]
MKTAVLTGGTGFLGFWLLKELVENDVFVYVVVRKNSKRRERLNGVSGVEIIELDMDEIFGLPLYIKNADVFYHLAWEGERNAFLSQTKNIIWAVNAMEVAHRLGVKQFIMTGSQAEYGIFSERVDENYPANPNTAYGACKLACYNILKTLSKQVALPFTWVRVFSVYGEGDNSNTLISYLFRCFKADEAPKLTRGDQLWDFLYAEDAAAALYLLGEKGKCGLYNLAFGESRPLKEFVIEARDSVSPNSKLDFSSDILNGVVELRANVDKIKSDLGWKPIVGFREGILRMWSGYNGKCI